MLRTSTAARRRHSRTCGSRFGKEVANVNKARLITLLITASLFAVLVARLAIVLGTGGINDGGYQ